MCWAAREDERNADKCSAAVQCWGRLRVVDGRRLESALVRSRDGGRVESGLDLVMRWPAVNLGPVLQGLGLHQRQNSSSDVKGTTLFGSPLGRRELAATAGFLGGGGVRTSPAGREGGTVAQGRRESKSWRYSALGRGGLRALTGNYCC